jgi:uncharacterized protein (DUF1778 family)
MILHQNDSNRENESCHRELSDFVVHTPLEATDEAIQSQQSLVLSAQDSKLFVQALLTQRGPNTKLKEALREHNLRIINPAST